MDRLSDGIHEVVSQICVHWICSIPSSGYCSPCLSSLPSGTVYNSGILDGMIMKWASLAASYICGEPRHLSHALTFSCGKSHWARSLSKTGLCYLGWGVMQVKWNCSYPLHCIQSWIFFFNGVLELLCWSPGLPQRLSCPWMIVKYVFFLGEDCQKLLYHYFDDTTPQLIFLRFGNAGEESCIDMLVFSCLHALISLGYVHRSGMAVEPQWYLKWLNWFRLPLTIQRNSIILHPQKTFSIVCLLNFTYSGKYVLVISL